MVRHASRAVNSFWVDYKVPITFIIGLLIQTVIVYGTMTSWVTKMDMRLSAVEQDNRDFKQYIKDASIQRDRINEQNIRNEEIMKSMRSDMSMQADATKQVVVEVRRVSDELSAIRRAP